MIRKIGLIVVVAAALFWVLTAPKALQAVKADVTNVTNGETVFFAAGCASCHAAPEAADRLVLAGGLPFKTQFGTFYAPNISPSVEHGIGAWTLEDFATALRLGVSPEGKHYFPVFPYTTYQNMTDQDVADLWAFMQSLPKTTGVNVAHDVSFPFSIRRNMGGWKMLFMPDPKQPQDRGEYLVEALGHCAECHTPRNLLGGWKADQWLQGGPNPTGQGKIPAIAGDALDWSVADIAEYLKSGFTPDYDVAGGEMVDVIKNTSQLSDQDREAIASYLKGVK